eukprot:518971-Amorphochlora_amoeboformis.AAC.3
MDEYRGLISAPSRMRSIYYSPHKLSLSHPLLEIDTSLALDEVRLVTYPLVNPSFVLSLRVLSYRTQFRWPFPAAAIKAVQPHF